jgi:predicted transposase YbfD/YdcC
MANATPKLPRGDGTLTLLLKHLDLKGALITMDAMGTRVGIAQRAAVSARCTGSNRLIRLTAFSAAHAFIYDHFHPPRHRLEADTYRTIPIDAFNVWQQNTQRDARGRMVADFRLLTKINVMRWTAPERHQCAKHCHGNWVWHAAWRPARLPV